MDKNDSIKDISSCFFLGFTNVALLIFRFLSIFCFLGVSSLIWSLLPSVDSFRRRGSGPAMPAVPQRVQQAVANAAANAAMHELAGAIGNRFKLN